MQSAREVPNHLSYRDAVEVLWVEAMMRCGTTAGIDGGGSACILGAMHADSGGSPAHHRRDIQGLRAVAVGLVLVFHLWPNWMSGGYVGVDVFFVISGFLITGHILREVAETGTINLARFWARRIRRLLPIAMTVLAATAIGVVLVAPRSTWLPTFSQIGASALYVENWALAIQSVDYLGQYSVPTAVQHYWSLSVEEQFYVLWPLLMLGLAALAARRGTPDRRATTVSTGLALLAAGSLAWSVVSTAQDQSVAYFSTFTRMWEFAAGALLAALPSPTRRLPSAVSWGCLGAVVWSAWAFSDASAFPGWIAFIPVIGTVGLLADNGPDTPHRVAWWLSLRPMVSLGDISYGVYLIHWPLVILVPAAMGRSLAWPNKLAIIAATVVLSWLARFIIEEPLRHHPYLIARPARSYAVAVIGAATLVLGTQAASASVSRQFAAAEADADAFLAQTAASPEAEGEAGCLGPAALDNAGCPPVFAPDDLLVGPAEVAEQRGSECQVSMSESRLRDCVVGDSDADRTVVLVGDSHADHFVRTLDQLGRGRDWKVQVHTMSSCPMSAARRLLPDSEQTSERAQRCEAWRLAVNASIVADPSVTDIFVSSYASAYEWGQVPGAPGLEDPMVDGFREQFEAWSNVGIRVHVLRDVPAVVGPVPACVETQDPANLACSLDRTQSLPLDPAAQASRSMADPAVNVIDLSDQFCDDTMCHGVVGGVIAYRDGSHISNEYASLLWPYVDAQVD